MSAFPPGPGAPAQIPQPSPQHPNAKLPQQQSTPKPPHAVPVGAPTSKPAAPAQPLLLLPSMFHGVLTQCADVFNTPSKHHPRATMHTSASLNAAVSAFTDRFHYGLDMLEMELLRAKAVLRRDLEVIQAERKEREEKEERARKEKEEKERAEREQREAKERAEREEKERKEQEEREKKEREEKEKKEREERERQQQQQAQTITIADSPEENKGQPGAQTGEAGGQQQGDTAMGGMGDGMDFEGFFGNMGEGQQVGQGGGEMGQGATGSFEDFMASMGDVGGTEGQGNGQGQQAAEAQQEEATGDFNVDDLFGF